MFEIFCTNKCFYLYDAIVNVIIEISEKDYNLLDRYLLGNQEHDVLYCLERFQEKGICKREKIECIEHSMTDVLPYYIDQNISNMILQVTQQCNLRCSYCVYSGNYVGRTHSGITMNFETATKAVDFYMQHNNNSESPTLGFYGGEPLLQIDLIKRIIEYTESKYPKRQLNYMMTVNGTLLDEKISDYLAEKKFTLLISLDGPKQIHDVDRKTIDGKGSFETIYRNLRYIRNNYPDFYKTIMTNTVIKPSDDYTELLEFFENDSLISDLNSRSSTVFDSELKENMQYDYSKFDEIIWTNRKNMLDNMIDGGKRKNYRLIDDYLFEMKKYCKILMSGSPYLLKNHPGGPCIPVARRLFVDALGNFYPCEKIAEIEDARIGSVQEGFDVEKIKKMINVGKTTANECSTCWAFQFCSSCIVRSFGKNGLDKNIRLSYCNKNKKFAKAVLRDICYLRENGVDIQEIIQK